MKILVTGSSGHVGGAIARYLHAQGNEVIGVSRNPSALLPETITQFSLDIGEEDFVTRARNSIDTCDAIIHAAACMETAIHDLAISKVNCLGTQQVIVLAKALEARALVYISSLSLLGLPVEIPVAESHPICPKDVYAASKLYGEHLLAMAASPDLATISFRISSPVGPGLTYPRIFRTFVKKALCNEPLVLHGKGTRAQDYVDVRDIACAVEAAVSRKDIPSGVFNIASGCPVSNLELATGCIEVLHSKSQIIFSGAEDAQDCVSWVMSIEKAASDLCYLPQYPLRASIADLADEMRQFI